MTAPLLRCLAQIAAAAFVCATAHNSFAAKPAITEIHGAGSTFVQPILNEWAYNWSAKSGVKIDYEGGGSGAGITKVKAGQVEFGATDAPLGEEDLSANHLVQFPIVT